MNVKELIKMLEDYNPEAEVYVAVNGHRKPYGVCYGGSEGVTQKTCKDVTLMVETNCECCKEL